MKRGLLVTLLIGIGLSLGFWLYGAGRTMRETVNFNLTASLSGILLALVFPLLFFLSVLVIKAIWFDGKKWPLFRFMIWLVSSVLVGCLASEAWILLDERRFSIEASKAKTIYSRARAWPNQLCSLVFIPGKGIHSTD